jgi:hypothetical protein
MRILKAVQPNSARSSSEPVMDVMASAKSDVLCVKNKGPRAVIDELAKSFPNDRARECWIEEARLAAIVGRVPGRSVRLSVECVVGSPSRDLCWG